MADNFLERLRQPVILSGMGASRMGYYEDWRHEEAPRRGLRDPWEHSPNKIVNREEIIENGRRLGWRVMMNESTEEEREAWKKERDEYRRQECEYVCGRVFHDYGYEAFLEECDFHNIPEYKKTFFPCESHSDSQCSFNCPIYKDCALRLCDEGAQKGDED